MMKYTTEELRIRLPCKASGIFQSYAKFYSSFGCCATISGHPTYPHFRRLGCHNVWSLQRRLSAVVWKLFGHVDISDESDADDRIGEVARSPKTLA